MPSLAPFLIYVVVTTFTPGPNNIMAMTNTVRYGFRNVSLFLAGIVTGFFVVLSICGFLNMWLVNLLPQMKTWLNLLGAMYMVYLAIHIMLSNSSKEDSGKKSLNTFLAGFSMQFLNVKVILYGITVFSMYIIQYYQHPVEVGLFALMLAGVGLMAVLSWSFGGHLFRNLLNKYGKIFNIVMGMLLIYTAVVSVF
ncbi:MAG: lysine transporter LysE [Anaerolinea sp.]|nr:lysine transporter LysE [Anaerolinea sp.]